MSDHERKRRLRWFIAPETYSPSGPIAEGERAAPGLVGFLGNPGELTVITDGQDLTGTPLEGMQWEDVGDIQDRLRILGSDVLLENLMLNVNSINHVTGANLTFRNCIINLTSAGEGSGRGIGQNSPDQGILTFEDTTVVCDSSGGDFAYSMAVGCEGVLVARRSDFSGSGDGIQCGAWGTQYAEELTIDQCVIRDLYYPDAGQHLDGIQVFITDEEASTAILTNNYVDGQGLGPDGAAWSASLMIGANDDPLPDTTVLIDNNYFGGGAYHMRLGYRLISTVTNNNFGSLTPVAETAFVDTVVPSVVWTNNRDGAGEAGTGILVLDPAPIP